MASFGSAIGISPALLEAAQSRGINLQSPASAGGGTTMPQPPSQLESAQAALPQPLDAGAVTPPTAPEAPDSDARIALKALSKVVTDESSTKKDLAKARIGGIL